VNMPGGTTFLDRVYSYGTQNKWQRNERGRPAKPWWTEQCRTRVMSARSNTYPEVAPRATNLGVSLERKSTDWADFQPGSFLTSLESG